MTDYIEDLMYEKDELHPGLCFAFSVEEQEDEEYTINMIFEDFVAVGDRT
jgi:hypothetical protein